MSQPNDIADACPPESTPRPKFRHHWIAFDAVGTLIYPDTPVAIAYQAVAARHGSLLSVFEFERCFHAAFRHTETNPFPGGPVRRAELTITSEEIEAARWRWIVRDLVHDLDDTEECFRELFEHFAQPSSWKCFDDVDDALRRLHQAGYRLAVASNFDRRLHGICDSLPELKPIERRVISSEVGHRKPSPRFYEALCHACGCDRTEVLMVGDDPEHDLAGPLSVGMPALLVARRAVRERSQAVSSLRELADRLT